MGTCQKCRTRIHDENDPHDTGLCPVCRGDVQDAPLWFQEDAHDPT